MSEHVNESGVQSAGAPFPPSWVDRLTGWIDGLPGPAWLFYALILLATAVLYHIVFWAEGNLPVGTFDLAVGILSLYTFYWLGLYHYLSRVGSRALATFRSLLDVGDTEIARINYGLAVLPRRLGWLALPLGIALSVALLLGGPDSGDELALGTAPGIFIDTVITAFLASTFLALIMRSVRQLRLVSNLQARASHIDLLDLDPTHAFSDLTARTGAGIMLLMIISRIQQETTNALDVALYLASATLAVGVFVVPIISMQRRLEKEKARVLVEMNDLLRRATDRLHRKILGDDYEGMTATEAGISALIRERDLLQKTSTWPWSPGTLRGFASTLLLPIFLWVVTRPLEHFI